jgi:uncharacterized HAD superfamily protein
MRIGLDFDGTIADTTGAKIRYAREVFGLEVTPLETWRAVGEPRLGPERFREMVVAAHHEYTEATEPMPGVLEVIERLAVDHELFIVTARTDQEVEWARRWVSSRALPVHALEHTNRASKLEASRRLALDVLLDDSPPVLLDIAEAGIGAALIETEYNRTLPRHVAVELVRHWPDFELLCGRLHAATARASLTP